MRSLFLLLFICCTLAFGCHKKVAETTTGIGESTSTPAKTITFGTTEQLTIGQTCKLEKSGVTFTFLDVVSDNRCPKGVNCMQAGEAVVMVQVSGQSPQRVIVDTDPKTISRLSMEGGNVEVLDLMPYPDTRIRIDPAQRALTIRMVPGEKMR